MAQPPGLWFDEEMKAPGIPLTLQAINYLCAGTKRVVLLLVCLPILLACQPKKEHHASFFVFGTIVEVVIADGDEKLAERAFALLQNRFQNLHKEWHAWEPGTLTRLNRALANGEFLVVGENISQMIRYSQTAERTSGGRFNPAIGKLISAWGFHTSDFPVTGPPPDKNLIQSLVALHPSSLDIDIRNGKISSTNPAVQLDFGGIAKGYALDLACQWLNELGVDNALISGGGDIKSMGNKNGTPWKVAIGWPQGTVLATLEVADGEAVFTSGNYHRYMEDDDQRYAHVLDPASGWPVRDTASVTVIATDGWLADAAATALLIAGAASWSEVAANMGLDEVLIIDQQGEVYASEAMLNRLRAVDLKGMTEIRQL